ncbi:collagen alpha-1(I) chain-like [Gorilla gorilla gorilla]|uniref:collagen alpha-1(I) chain-like n=1 Tax=Gorilla gorilla gorilla TaxID=9595 RepID=UPI002445DB01|nr:collagen alpha-1(I) chain-like [Gorilla gorilla gorilla]
MVTQDGPEHCSGEGFASLCCRGSLIPQALTSCAAPGQPGLGGSTPEGPRGIHAPSSFPPAKGGGAKRREENTRRKPESSRFSFKSPDGRSPEPEGRENVGKDSLPNFASLCLGGWGLTSPGRAGPRARPCAPVQRPRSPGARHPGTRPRSRARTPTRTPAPPGEGGRGSAYQIVPSAPRSRRAQRRVKFTSGPRAARGPRARLGRREAREAEVRVAAAAAPELLLSPRPRPPTFCTVAELEVSGLRGHAGLGFSRGSEVNKQVPRPSPAGAFASHRSGLLSRRLLGAPECFKPTAKCSGHRFFCGVVRLGTRCFLKGCWHADHGPSDGAAGRGLEEHAVFVSSPKHPAVGHP